MWLRDVIANNNVYIKRAIQKVLIGQKGLLSFLKVLVNKACYKLFGYFENPISCGYVTQLRITMFTSRELFRRF